MNSSTKDAIICTLIVLLVLSLLMKGKENDGSSHSQSAISQTRKLSIEPDLMQLYQSQEETIENIREILNEFAPFSSSKSGSVGGYHSFQISLAEHNRRIRSNYSSHMYVAITRN